MTVEADRTIEDAIAAFIRERTKSEPTADFDLFASGLVSSLFAMELLVHLEQTFAVTVDGPDLKLDNFRTVTAMAALVRRLRGER